MKYAVEIGSGVMILVYIYTSGTRPRVAVALSGD
jgi:hypothetical protein